MLRSKTQLHETLKHYFAEEGGQLEARVGRYWVDVLLPDRVVEIQTGNFHGLRGKLERLAQKRHVQIVYPIPVNKVLVKRERADGPVVSRRRSPRHGRREDVFAELVNLTGLLPHPSLTLTLLLTEEEEHRLEDGKGSWRRKGVSVVDRVLTRVVEQLDLCAGEDYLRLWENLPESPFTNRQLAEANHRPPWLARRATYFLSRGGVLEAVGRTREGLWYAVTAEKESAMTKPSADQGCPHCGKPIATYRNPLPTVDLIIETKGGIVLVERENPPHGWALPGGFVDYGESLEEAAVREAKEETGLTVKLLEQFHTYGDPHRDPRHHCLTVVYLATARGKPKGGDDARRAQVFAEGDLPALVFDHREILDDYFAYRRRLQPLKQRRAQEKERVA